MLRFCLDALQKSEIQKLSSIQLKSLEFIWRTRNDTFFFLFFAIHKEAIAPTDAGSSPTYAVKVPTRFDTWAEQMDNNEMPNRQYKEWHLIAHL